MNTVVEEDHEESGRASSSLADESSMKGSGCQTESSSKFSLARSETARINRSKFILLCVILIVAITSSVLTFQLVSNQEQQKYEAKFHDISNELAEYSQIKKRAVLNNMESFGVTLTSYALDGRFAWPFVTFPDFQVQGMLSNQATGAHTISINPLVYPKDLEAWSTYSVNHQEWMSEARDYDRVVHPDLYTVEHYETGYQHNEALRWNVTGITPFVWKYQEDPYAPRQRVSESLYYTPIWQRAPRCDFSTQANLDLRSDPTFTTFIDGMLAADHPVLTKVVDATYLRTNYEHRFDPTEQAEPHSYLLGPVYDNLTYNRTAVAFLAAFMRWGSFFTNVLPSTEQGIYVVLDNSCSQTFTYEIFGQDVVYLGEGNLHDTSLDGDGLEDMFEFSQEMELDEDGIHKFCNYHAHIYPSSQWREPFFTSEPYYYAAAVFGCFVITALGFMFYDILVQRRQATVMKSAARTNAIVTSLFPANVRDRLLEDAEAEMNKHNEKTASSTTAFLNNGSTKFGVDQYTSAAIFGTKPIADLFPETTIMFADLVGFTAWSSTREPTQVFTLLETLYHAFDVIAKRRRVFKVETVGDCYVAVAGLPEPRKDHAVVMGKFATDCLNKMLLLVRQMETSLGPDTGDLTIRIGLHSGPVTAGVLRGDKGRFQLFGDTMNTASRMETTGKPGKIHISQDTAEILVSAGRSKWVTQREDRIFAKGKGSLQTFWFKILSESHATGSNMTNESSVASEDETAKLPRPTVMINKTLQVGTALQPDETLSATPASATLSSREQRLVSWNVDILLKLVQQIMAHRLSLADAPNRSQKVTTAIVYQKRNILDEVQEVLSLPQYDAKMSKKTVNPNTIEVPEKAVDQLRDMVTKIAGLYRQNPFHNFEHASHVTMSVTKLMSRIVSKDTATNDLIGTNVATLHDNTFGITSDPLTQFACVLSGLIHDADHPGVPNSTLVKEEHSLAKKYNNKSVAEQNSVDLAWEIITDPAYKELQGCIFTNVDEFNRFRSIIVNVVMATDILDKDLGAQRKSRWEKAFSQETDSLSKEDTVEAVNRKATVVLEHLMQASDVAHTMQHWVVYKKWNERLFDEMYTAFVDGRSDKDPSLTWYQGELGFFDYYIIPLAKKLETCGVFGVSSHEYLSYAQGNRREWAEKGEAIVKDYVRNYHINKGGAGDSSAEA